jgi:YrbI family 3-deoxy-D-manno-octulosonate 8-phosphate phosphatase
MTESSTDIIAIIPARSGSKRLPGKNTAIVGGRPLIAHTIRHAVTSARIQKIYVSTDDAEIAAIAELEGAETIHRPPELAGDDASSESALLHVLEERNKQGLSDPEILVFLQCTSPIRGDSDIDSAIATFEQLGADSLFSGSDNKRHIWTNAGDGYAPLNYDYRHRKREQDMPTQYNEDGSIYVLKPKILRQFQNRLGGKIEVYPIGPWREYQLDTQEDLELIDWVLQRSEFAAPIRLPSPIELIVFDFDGVFTDNKVLTDSDGKEFVRADRGDGLGIARLRKQRIPMFVLSTEENPVTAARCKKLGLECQHGVTDKAARLKEILKERDISAKNTLYVGNDLNDAGCLKLVGFPIIVADAHPAVHSIANLVLTRNGGDGAVRELCDLILSQNSYSHSK